MSSQPVAPGPISVPAIEEPKKNQKKKSVKGKGKLVAETPKPTKTLPNWRLGVAKQIDIVRAYAAGSSKGTRPVTLEEAAEIAGMAPTTVIMAHAFLTSVGLIKRNESGGFLPSPEAVSFLSAYEWDAKTAAYKLAPKLREAWFSEALLPRISYGSALDERVAVNVLAEAAGASPEYERELRMILEFMGMTGVVQREAGQIKQIRPNAAAGDPIATPPRTEEPRMPELEPTPQSARVKTSFASQSPDGGIDFNIAVHVDMGEFGNWRPERIQAFFRGIAEVLAAKADVEKGGAGS